MSVILQAPYPVIETTTTLPNPQFSDVEGRKVQVEVRRSMNNTKRTYVKSNERRALTYSFRLTRAKALELRALVTAYYRSKLLLTNHKNERWLVNFTSNPFEFTGSERAADVPGGEMVTISLNFEGTVF